MYIFTFNIVLFVLILNPFVQLCTYVLLIPQLSIYYSLQITIYYLYFRVFFFLEDALASKLLNTYSRRGDAMELW
jgi:hypothetical protein